MAPKPRLKPNDIDAITGMIESWKAKLTWEALIDRVSAVFGRTYTRQALERHDQLKRAFQIRKRRLRADADAARGRGAGAVEEDLSPALALERRRRQALEERVARLEATINAYDERFATWLYNARLAGLTKQRLNAPLPAPIRHRSDDGGRR